MQDFVSAAYHSSKQDVERQVIETRHELDSAVTCGSIWVGERKGSAGAAVQSGLTAVSGFLENFSGLVEIAKGADQQYGGLAYGTLSLLLSVVVRKSKHEEAYLDSFEELGYAFPRLETLLRLDPYERLERLVATTFADVIRFARQATEYYSSGRQRIKVAFKPENDALGQVRKGLSRIREECDIFMLQQIDELRLEVGNIRVQLETTRAGVHRTERNVLTQINSADTLYLAELRGLLGLKEMSPHIDLVSYGEVLREHFSAENLYLKHSHPREVSMQLLSGDDDFHLWWDAETSCVLLAGGSNCTEDNSTGTLNWLSMGAVLAVEQLRTKGKNIAYFLVQPDYSSQRCPLRSVLASLLYQLAEMHDNRLRSRLDRIQYFISRPCWRRMEPANGDKELMEGMYDVLVDVFSAFMPEDEINIVVDRLDRCELDSSDDLEAPDTVRNVLEMLLRVTTKAKCRIKVLLTIDAWCSRKVLRQNLMYLRPKERKRLRIKADWAQEIIDDDDSSFFEC